jgi:hypothetical protein
MGFQWVQMMHDLGRMLEGLRYVDGNDVVADRNDGAMLYSKDSDVGERQHVSTVMMKDEGCGWKIMLMSG